MKDSARKILAEIFNMNPDEVIVAVRVGDQFRCQYHFESLNNLAFLEKLMSIEVTRCVKEVVEPLAAPRKKTDVEQ